MGEIKKIFKHFWFSEIPFLMAIIYLGISMKEMGELFFVFVGIYIVQLTIYNLILTILFYFFNKIISKKISLIFIVLFSSVLIYLFLKKNYFEGLSIDYYNYHKKYQIVFLITHISDVIIWLCLILNQLLVKFYYVIWQKMKKVWKREKRRLIILF
ncbi:hypothetical protein [Flavobacterium collinsii]|uniref:Uncharacterized protein n=1 Tax=Flavobacterium collinsii TaxID=1114861 RepID=A0A9W4TKW3_9FLAO|nr:hypothetical protein [Flavobacterium collinsii]CAA9203445.1 hypothetical protein FLACOL7796_04745 [Flavobacterium collinsii]CAI2768807.1 conserved membrane protein of unknown function [Flavobacterium collinsii]